MLFSIIIPMLNAEGTLDRCLSSIQQQSFQDYQVIIVDDGSSDNSVAVANGYAQSDSRFFVLSMPHGGTGAARNRGVSQAEGEYILFLDADDYWVRDDLLLSLQSRIEGHATDIFMYQMLKVTDDGVVLKRYTKPAFYHDNMVLELKDIYQDLVRDGQVLASACNKCVRAALLRERNIQFREDVFGEDIDWVLQLFSTVQTICLLNLYAYAYTQHKHPSRSSRKDAPNDLVSIVHAWSLRLTQGNISHARAVAGLTAFEYGICMGNNHLLSNEKKTLMRESTYLLKYGLDKKTKLIYRFYRIFGYALTCAVIRGYLFLRRIW